MTDATQEINLYRKLLGHLSSTRRRQFGYLTFLMLLASVSEVLSIGMALPFLSAITQPDVLLKNKYINGVVQYFDIETKNIVLIITVAFIFLVIFSALVRLSLVFLSTRLSLLAGSDLSCKIFKNVLDQKFTYHAGINSGTLIDVIANKSNGVIYNVLMPFTSIFSAMLIVVSIVVVLMLVDPVVAIITFLGFSGLYGLIIYFTRNRIFQYSGLGAKQSTKVIVCLQESMGGIRDILIDSTQETYHHIYKNIDISLRRAQAGIIFIGSSPKLVVEALAMALMALIAYQFTKQENSTFGAIAVLGAFAIGAQKIIPLLQQSYAAWTCIKGSEQALVEVVQLLDLPSKAIIDQEQLLFERNVEFRDVYYSYPSANKFALEALNIKINRGEKVGIIGATGCGKSTFLDLLMGLLEPVKGSFLVDGVFITERNNSSWQKHIAHVPQSVFLSDASIAENIAFGVSFEGIDRTRLNLAVKLAQLDDYVGSLPQGLQTLVGERGIRLSGGQRQRIGIARALYKQADVLFLDEATSALDSDTERKIMDSIQSLDKAPTIFMVAHRISTLSSCDRIIELEAGQIKRVCQYSDLKLSEDAQR